ncbi:heavy metal translocating P-type ATPase [Dokdonella fugitiva]|uniref:heavy metal translocating P-type ATPase n=1 Tax=Dokdonella fugitiva TaxID=328517 RepID=UPI0015F887B5|nr:heavy metal translocating P-type ATPase [Dokdonella fugitiva]MBA8884138.1 Cu2+-exporting ATPase [Dokdonella fugitiva]
MTGACWHCGEPLPAGEPLEATVAGVAHAVCCHGCRGAAEWIDQLGLADYYRLRSEPAARPRDGTGEAATWRRADLARHVVRDLGDGRHEALVLVDGVRCAACVWLIERMLGSLPGVERVVVNAAARRARIVWDDARCELARVLDAFERAGYRALPLDAGALDDSRRTEARTALKRLVVAGFGAMQAMMYASALYLGAFDGMDASTRDLFRWLGLLVASPVVLYAARPFFAGAWRALRARHLSMDVPVSLALALIYTASVVEAIRGGREVYFDSVSMFVFFLLLGRQLEMHARHRAGDLGDALARLTPAFAERILADGSTERIAAAELHPGDHVRVASGVAVPADGVLVGAACRVDEALLSGESAPVARRDGDTLVAGSIVVEGPARLRVERVGADTALAGIVALVSRAQAERPRLARAGERAAARFVARVLALAALTAAGWSMVEPTRAFAATLAVLVVSCPCAFALAVPAALTRALALLARRGVLVVHPDAIETLAGATHVVFDKTGTLTEPGVAVERIDARTSAGADALALAAALARHSHHPVSRAIVAAAGNDAHTGPAVACEVEEVAGLGLRGRIGGRELRLGRADFALDPRSSSARMPGTDGDGATTHDDAVVLADDDGLVATFRIGEHLRPGAHDAIDALTGAGLAVEIASGDAASKVAALARRLGVAQWRARQSPADKLERLRALRAHRARLIAVGDGINDAPVLAGADVAVAIGSGSDLAQASSDVVLARADLGALPEAVTIARETMRVLRLNQRWALAYNVVAVPFGALGLVPPWLAALGMSASSLAVVVNATRIGRRRRAKPALPHPHEALA